MSSKFYQILIIVVFAYICSVAIYTTWGLFQIQLNNKSAEWFYYTRNDRVYKLKVADTTGLHVKGLSNIKERPEDYDGMIFMFKEKRIVSFWNKDLFVDLDILWLEDFKIVGSDNLPSYSKSGLKVVAPQQPVNYAIELFK